MAGNRDELHVRPTAALARWESPEQLIAGRDLQSGGTWAGVSEQGRFAVVTNLRGYDAPSAERASRGALVVDQLAGEGQYADPDRADLDDFNPFNLIVADRERALFLSNRPELVRSPLGPGLYGLSNGALDAPWPKTLRLKQMLLDWIVSGAVEPHDLLDDLDEDRLPDTGLVPREPSEVDQEPIMSPIFIRNQVYGTRCSTVVAIDVDGQGAIGERRYSPSGEVIGETVLRFSWPM